MTTTRKTKSSVRMPMLTAVNLLKQLQRQRQFSIVSQSRSDRATESYIARLLGFVVARDEEERKASLKQYKATFKEAQRIRSAIERGKPVNAKIEITEGTIALVQNSALSRKSWDAFREASESGMREAVKSLPVYDFAQSVRGFGELGLGIIVAESGNLAKHIEGFPSVAKVWKRLGLAVIDGRRQQRITSDPELAIRHGYSPRRRAEIWTLADSMFRAQWTSELSAYKADIMANPKARAYVEKNEIDLAALAKDEDEGIEAVKKIAAKFGIECSARPGGPYGEVYAHRRANTADRGWTPAHVNADAKRVMMKALIRDIWRVWNGQEPRYARHEDTSPQAEAAD